MLLPVDPNIPHGPPRRLRKRPASPPRPEPRQVPPEALAAHAQWLAAGRSGDPPPLTGDYPGADLRGQNLTGADLRGVQLVGADLTDARLWDADLTDADLTDARGLAPSWDGKTPPLSGAVLSRAKLPEDIAKFEALANIAELSKNAGKMFVSLLTADVFMQLIVAQTTDVQLVTNSGTTTIPIISATIPIATLFWLGPLALLTLYVAFHLYLQRLWEMLAGLPAVFPDGMPLTQKSYPWLLSDMVRLGFPRLAEQPLPLAWAQGRLFVFLAYTLVPVSLFPFWARYLCRHEWTITAWHIACAVVFVWAGLVFYWLGRTTLRRDQTTLDFWREPWGFTRTHMAATRMLLAGGCGALVWLLSLGTITWGVPPEWEPGDMAPAPPALGLRKAIPSGLQMLGYRPFANLAGAELSAKPDRWTDSKLDQTAWVRHPAHLDFADLRYANLSRSFLVSASLRNADLSYANFASADLRGADLLGTRLTGAQLERTTLTGADMAWTTLAWADLGGANLSHVDLSKATLTGAYLEATVLTGADLSGAVLTDTRPYPPSLRGARWTAQTVWPAGFDPRREPGLMEVDEEGRPVTPTARAPRARR